ncbi:helix-turn-helix domain-containing protein [Haladaptatus sp. NG-WS-4]
MTVTADMTISGEQFVLGTVLLTDTDVHVELERVIPASRQVLPFFWAVGTEFESFEREVETNPHVEDLVAVDRGDDRILYRVVWGDEVESLIHGIAAVGATILEAYGNGEWRFRLRFDDHAELAEFDDYCDDHDIRYRLERVMTDTNATRQEFGLTPEQREALVLAVERGYFDVPRNATLGDLADEFDISQQALSERVRRAAGTVLRTVLFDSDEEDF